jgi:ABC-type phosphate transport system permease subunit
MELSSEQKLSSRLGRTQALKLWTKASLLGCHHNTQPAKSLQKTVNQALLSLMFTQVEVLIMCAILVLCCGVASGVYLHEVSKADVNTALLKAVKWPKAFIKSLKEGWF